MAPYRSTTMCRYILFFQSLNQVHGWGWNISIFSASKSAQCIVSTLAYFIQQTDRACDSMTALDLRFFFCDLDPSTYVLLWTLLVFRFWLSRSTLVELGCFGDPALQMKALLLEAWEDFRAWCKDQRIHTGQGRFTSGLATQMCTMLFFSDLCSFQSTIQEDMISIDDDT